MSYITKMTIVLYSTQFLHIGKKTISAMLSLATTLQPPTTQLTSHAHQNALHSQHYPPHCLPQPSEHN